MLKKVAAVVMSPVLIIALVFGPMTMGK